MFENFIIDHNKEDKNELAGIRDILPKKDEQSFNNDNKLKLTLTSFFAIDFGFSKTERKKDGSNFELNTVSSFQNTRASNGELKLTVLIVCMFTLLWKAIVKCYCFPGPIRNFFFDTCQMTVKKHNEHLFQVPPNRKPHNKQFISLVFSVHIVNITDPCFFRQMRGK